MTSLLSGASGRWRVMCVHEVCFKNTNKSTKKCHIKTSDAADDWCGSGLFEATEGPIELLGPAHLLQFLLDRLYLLLYLLELPLPQGLALYLLQLPGRPAAPAHQQEVPPVGTEPGQSRLST